MSRVMLLTKAFLKSNFTSENSVKKRMKKGWEYTNIIAILFAFIIFTFSISTMLFGIYDFLDPIKQTGMMVALGYNIYSLVVFIFGIMSVITVFYFAKDVEYVLPLPFKSWEISLAKFFSVLVYQYISGLFIFVPVTISYGYKSGAGILFYLVSILCFIMIPILPLVYSSLISMVLMRFTSISKHKDGFRIVAGILAMVFALGINLFTNNMTRSGFENPEAVQKLLAQGNNSLISTISNLFITSKLGALAATNSESYKTLANIVLLILISIIALAIFIIISNSFYLKGAIGASESYGKKSKLSNTSMERNIVENSRLKAWIKKEFIILFRTPAYLLNCVAIVILLPFILGFSLFAEGDLNTTIGMIKSLLENKEMYSLVLISIFGGVLFTCCANPTAATSISREGEKIFLSKFLPVSYKTQINAKIISSIILNGATILVLIIGLLILQVDFYLIGMIIVLSILILYFTAASGVLIDLASPKLIWDNEQKAVKQNMNSLKSIIVGILLGVITIGPVILFKANISWAFSILFGITLLVDIILYTLISIKGVQWFKNLAD
ncbi:hypothetical protein [Clostridium sp.]|uniref:putative ABC transporter permease subunit n=1 Tax=Clostridium sp. TaxID=1506 RepID=UPI002FC8F070